jgi:hypothetical protein
MRYRQGKLVRGSFEARTIRDATILIPSLASKKEIPMGARRRDLSAITCSI